MWLKFRGLSVVIYSSSTAAAADEGLTREVHGLQPWCLLGVLPAGSQGQGNFPAVWAAPGHDHISHNAQKHFHHLPPTPLRPFPLSLHVFSLLAPPSPSVFPLRFPFLSLPSPLPAFWRYTHTMIEASSSWPLVLQHFLFRLWRLTLCPINAAFRGLFLGGFQQKKHIHLGCCLLTKPKDGL